MVRQDRLLHEVLVSWVNARDQERATISRLLHDEVGQVLSAVGLHLTVLRMDLQDGAPEAANRTREIQEMLEQTFSLIRDLSYQLNPDLVERVGLHYALERLVARYRTPSGVPVLQLFDYLTEPAPLQVARAFYEIAEQALANAVRHAAAAQVQLILKQREQTITLEVRDNGKGISPNVEHTAQFTLGMSLIQFHAEQAGLRLKIKSNPGKGTTVKCMYMPAPEPEPTKPPEQAASNDGATAPKPM